MKRNVYIAYFLWAFFGWLGAHRIYCGKFISGFLMMAICWFGGITANIGIGLIFLAIFGIWWVVDIFLTGNWVESINDGVDYKKNMAYGEKIKNIETLYDLYQKGAISESEYQARKEILMRT